MPDKRLVKQLRSKNKKGIKEAYERFSPKLLAVCMYYFQNQEEAKDAMHEGFLKALNKIESFNDEGSFEGWLKRIVINHSLDLLKKNNKYYHQEIEEHHLTENLITESASIDKKDIDKETANIDFVREADFTSTEIIAEIHRLPKMYSLVFILFVLEEYSHVQIAQKLEINEKVSRTRLSRARKMLKEAIYQKSISVLAK